MAEAATCVVENDDPEIALDKTQSTQALVFGDRIVLAITTPIQCARRTRPHVGTPVDGDVVGVSNVAIHIGIYSYKPGEITKRRPLLDRAAPGPEIGRANFLAFITGIVECALAVDPGRDLPPFAEARCSIGCE